LEDDVAAKAKRHFPAYQTTYATLAAELRALDLPGAQRIDELCADLAEVVSGDGTDAIKRMGGPESALNDTLIWAKALKQAFGNGLKETLMELREMRNEIGKLPNTQVFDTLRTSTDGQLAEATDLLARERFFDENPALNQVLKQLNAQINEAVKGLGVAQEELRTSELAKWQRQDTWSELLPEDKEWINEQVGTLTVEPGNGLNGLRKLLTHEYELNDKLRGLDKWVHDKAASRIADRVKYQEPEKGSSKAAEPVVTEEMLVPRAIERIEDIDRMIEQLKRVRSEMAAGRKVRFDLKLMQEAVAKTKKA
jgi:hypothetical protein